MAERRYGRIAKFVQEYPWAMLEGPLEAMLEVLELRLDGGAFTAEEIQERITAAAPGRVSAGAVAVLPIYGVLAHRMNMLTAISGGMSTELLGKAFDQAIADPAVRAIVFDVDSPGGSVFGVQELAEKIYRARGAKPIVAVANATAASAAYWLASQADELLVTPSGQVGSVGAMAVHIDRSKQAEKLGLQHTIIKFGRHKDEQSDLRPLSADALADMQRRVDQYGEAFVRGVARARGVTPAVVREQYGEGRMFSARDAKRLGMVDGITTLEDALARLAGGATSAIAAGPTAELVEPDENGDCPEGYRKTEDGRCELMPVDGARTEAADFRRRLAELTA